jgi:carboxymethylenebutenolidase
VGEWIDMATSTRAWLARPEAGEGPGVLVLHAWWGLNDTFRGVADRLASEGFVALAPDLYGGVVVDTIEAAEREAERRPYDETFAVVREAAAWLGADPGAIGGGIGVVGFSMGAFWALELAAARPADPAVEAVGLVYGTGRERDWRGIRAAFQGHFASLDPYEGEAYVTALESALRAGGGPVRFHRYPGTGHWFMEPDRADAYDRAAAETVWARLVPFLRENLGGDRRYA